MFNDPDLKLEALSKDVTINFKNRAGGGGR